MIHKVLTVLILALLTVSTAQGEVASKKKTVTTDPEVDSLQLIVLAGDSCMEQFNTLEALKYYQQAFTMKDTAETRMKLADCYYKRANYRQTSNLLKIVPVKDLSHEALRQLCYSYQKQSDNDSFIYWTSCLVANYPMDGEMVAGLTVALAKENQAWKGIGYGEGYFKKDSTNILVNRALGDAYFMDRQFDKAAAMYERLLQQGDSTFNTLYSVGMCYTRLDSLNLAYKCLLPAFLISGMQHAGCAYRLGAVSIDLGSYQEGLGYLDLALKLMQPDTTTMRAITLSQGEGYYLTKQYDKAVEAWQRHLAYNPTSIATYYNIASARYYFLDDAQEAKASLEKFLQLARKEEKPTPQLTEMMQKAEELLRTTAFRPSSKSKPKAR
jgi:tetratricopeptide (TPR) repeat protein